MKLKKFLIVLITSLSFFGGGQVFADTKGDIKEIDDSGVESYGIEDTPYIIDVRQLSSIPFHEVALYSDKADENRNITINAKRILGYFNFFTIDAKHNYVFIVEDATNLKVLKTDMGYRGSQFEFFLGPNTFRRNHSYTIYRSHDGVYLSPEGRFKVTDAI